MKCPFARGPHHSVHRTLGVDIGATDPAPPRTPPHPPAPGERGGHTKTNSTRGQDTRLAGYVLIDWGLWIFSLML
jgi:hypothetical protein